MKLGILILPEYSWPEAKPLWQLAEAMGFAHAWTYDHLTWRSFRNQAWYAAVPTLTAAAAVTAKIRLGTLVASPNFRHPLSFAKELIALEDISNGRFTLGVGAGSSSWDATMLNQDPWTPTERANRFGEFVQMIDQLLREPESSYEGQFYATHEARTYPGCLQKPRLPFAIAASGKRGMKLAAQFGQWWVTTGDYSHEGMMDARAGARLVQQQMAQLDTICRQVGRKPASLKRLVLSGPRLESGLNSMDAFQDTINRYADIGVTDFVVHWPRPTDPYKADQATFERIFAHILKS